MYGKTKGQCPKTSECKVPSSPINPLTTDKSTTKSSKPDNK